MLSSCIPENRVLQGHSQVGTALFNCDETGGHSHNANTKLDGEWIASLGRIVSHVTKNRKKKLTVKPAALSTVGISFL